MINNKLEAKNTTISNNYQETGTVIYTGDGITTITGLPNVQAGELLIQPNNIAGQNKRVSIPTCAQMLGCVVDTLGNPLDNVKTIISKANVSVLNLQSSRSNKRKETRNLYSGRRYFSGSTTTAPNLSKGPDCQEKLSPIALPQFDLTSTIYSFIVHSLLFALMMREKFLISLVLVLCCLCFSFFYYFFFKNKERVREFLIQMRRAIASQPMTIVGIIKKVRLFILAWWILVIHFFFYTIGGYISWTACTTIGIFFSIYAYIELNFIPWEINILLLIMNMGIVGALTCQFCFWKEKKRLFLYANVEKKFVLLLVQNMLLYGFWSKIFKPAGAAAFAGYIYLLGSGASQDRANERMYDSACDVAKSQGKPAPDPHDFQRKGPSWEIDINVKEGNFRVGNKK